MAVQCLRSNMLCCKFMRCPLSSTRSSVLRNYICNNVRHATGSSIQEDSSQAEVKVTDPHSIDDVRNVSRLPSHLRNRMKHVMESPEVENLPHYYHNTSRYKRRLYAKYGSDSELDPGFLWPSKEELKEMMQIEEEFEPSLQELWAKVAAKKKTDEKEKMDLDQKVQQQMAKMPQYVEQFRAKMSKNAAQQDQSSAKQKRLLDEARDFFGYDVSTKDPRFKQLREAKEEEEKNARKKRAREERKAAGLARLQASAAQARERRLTEAAAAPTSETQTEQKISGEFNKGQTSDS